MEKTKPFKRDSFASWHKANGYKYSTLTQSLAEYLWAIGKIGDVEADKMIESDTTPLIVKRGRARRPNGRDELQVNKNKNKVHRRFFNTQAMD